MQTRTERHATPIKGTLGRFRRFKQLGLLEKVRGAVKYYITSLGKDVLAAALQLRKRVVIPSLRTA